MLLWERGAEGRINDSGRPSVARNLLKIGAR